MENWITKLKHYSIQITISIGVMLLLLALFSGNSSRSTLKKHHFKEQQQRQDLEDMRSAYTGSWSNPHKSKNKNSLISQAQSSVKTPAQKAKTKKKKKKKKKVVKRKTKKKTFSVDVVGEGYQPQSDQDSNQPKAHKAYAGAFAPQKVEDDTSKLKTFEEWVELIERSGSREVINDLVLSFEAQLTKEDTFYAVAEYLLNHKNIKFKRMGVVALNLTPGDKSFTKIVLFIEREPLNSDASQDAKAFLKSYSNKNYMNMLNRMLFSENSSVKIQSAIRIKETVQKVAAITTTDQTPTDNTEEPPPSNGLNKADQALFSQSLSYLQSLIPSLTDPSVSPYFQSTAEVIQKLLNS